MLPDTLSCIHMTKCPHEYGTVIHRDAGGPTVADTSGRRYAHREAAAILPHALNVGGSRLHTLVRWRSLPDRSPRSGSSRNPPGSHADLSAVEG